MFHSREVLKAGAAAISSADARPAKARRPSQGPVWARRIRLLHLCLASLFAPAILFFAFTGALQTFNLHKSKPSAGYTAPSWIVSLASVHKRQTLAPKADPEDRPAPAKHAKHERPPQSRPTQDRPTEPSQAPTAVLKGFTLAVSLGLVASTLSGLYLAFRFSRKQRLILALLLCGLLAPLALLVL